MILDEEDNEEKYDYQNERDYIFDDISDIRDKLLSLSMKIENMEQEIFRLKLRTRPKSSMMEVQNLAVKNETETD
jgi:hypothetical protein